MQPRLKIILDLVGLIYDSVEDASRWQTFLDAFVGAVRARGGVLALRDSKHDGFALVRWSGWSDEDIHLYTQRYSATDPWRIGTVRWPEGVVPQIWTFAPERRWNQALRFANFTVLGMAFTGSVGPFWLLVQASQSSLRYALPQPAPSDWRKKQSCAP